MSGATLVQHATNTAGGSVTTYSTAFGSNNTAGDLLVILIAWTSATSQTASITDSTTGGGSPNTWTAFSSAANNGTYYVQAFYALNCAAGANTVKVTWTGAVNVLGVEIAEHGNVAAFSSHKTVNGVAGVTFTPPADSLIMGVANCVGSGLTTSSFSGGSLTNYTGGLAFAYDLDAPASSTTIDVLNTSGCCCGSSNGDNLASFGIFTTSGVSAPQDPLGFGAEA